MIVWGAILLLAAIGINLFLDLNRGYVKNHFTRSFIKILSCAPSIYFFVKGLEGVNIFIAIIIVLFLEFSVFIILFNGFYNILRSQNWWFTGSDEGKGDALSDRFFRMVGKTAQKIIQFSMLIAAILFYRNKSKK